MDKEFIIEDDILMEYVGNKEEWNLINKEDNWDTNTSYQIIFN